MDIEIPQKDISIIESILVLSDEQFEELLACVKRMPPELSPQPLANMLEKTTLKNSNLEFSEVIIRILFAFVRLKDDGTELDKCVISFYNSFAQKSGNADKEYALVRFTSLASLTLPVESAYKVILAKRENGKYVTDQKLSLQVKPIFSDDLEKNGVGVVFSYNLKLEYEDSIDDSSETIIITFDKANIEFLKQLIFLVEEQTKTLAQEFNKTSLKIID